MSFTTTSSYMSLPIPTVGQEAGPTYATDINNCLTLIDQHNHTPGSGQLITPSAININADLTMGGYSLTSIKSLVLAAQTSVSTALALYVAPGGETVSIDDLWFNDGNGTAIQITKDGLVNATIGSLAGQSYAAGTFVWKQGAGSTTPAYFDIASITLRPATAATTYGTTIQPNASLATSFTLTLPNNPSGLGGNSFLTMDASGNITANALVSGGLTTSNLSASAGITGGQIAATTVSSSNMTTTGVTAASYIAPTITVDAAGRITAASSNVTALASGTYTPTAAAASGCTATPSVFQYSRVGTTVTASGSVAFSRSNAGATADQFTLSLPVSSNNFSIVGQAGGSNGGSTIANGIVYATTSAQTVTVKTRASNPSSDTYAIEFTYQIV